MNIGLISDAHGNLDAFSAGLNLLYERCEQIYFLGDAIGYIPRLGVVDKLYESGLPCLQGNHEAMLLGEVIDKEKDEIYRLSDVKTLLTDKQLDYLGTWPRSMELELNGQNIMLVHGSPLDNVFGYVYPDTDLSVFSDINADVVFMGNTHHPFIREYNKKLFVNIGSCGLPRDTSAKGCVCVYDSINRKTELLKYDISASAQEILNDPMVHKSVKRHLQRAAQIV